MRFDIIEMGGKYISVTTDETLTGTLDYTEALELASELISTGDELLRWAIARQQEHLSKRVTEYAN